MQHLRKPHHRTIASPIPVLAVSSSHTPCRTASPSSDEPPHSSGVDRTHAPSIHPHHPVSAPSLLPLVAFGAQNKKKTTYKATFYRDAETCLMNAVDKLAGQDNGSTLALRHIGTNRKQHALAPLKRGVAEQALAPSLQKTPTPQPVCSTHAIQTFLLRELETLRGGSNKREASHNAKSGSSSKEASVSDGAKEASGAGDTAPSSPSSLSAHHQGALFPLCRVIAELDVCCESLAMLAQLEYKGSEVVKDVLGCVTGCIGLLKEYRDHVDFKQRDAIYEELERDFARMDAMRRQQHLALCEALDAEKRELLRAHVEADQRHHALQALEVAMHNKAKDDHERCIFLSQSLVEMRILLEQAHAKAKDYDVVSRALQRTTAERADYARECIYLHNLLAMHAFPFQSTLAQERIVSLKSGESLKGG